MTKDAPPHPSLSSSASSSSSSLPRPWDKPRRLYRESRSVSSSSLRESRFSSSAADLPPVVPCIQLGGGPDSLCYYSDRFYLNTTAYDLPPHDDPKSIERPKDEKVPEESHPARKAHPAPPVSKQQVHATQSVRMRTKRTQPTTGTRILFPGILEEAVATASASVDPCHQVVTATCTRTETMQTIRTTSSTRERKTEENMDKTTAATDKTDRNRPDDATKDDEVAGTARHPPSCSSSSSSSSPVVLFDRAKLLASLSLRAAILATYSVDAGGCCQAEFPSLVGPQATVPTLILHGQKGWTLEEETATTENESDLPESFPSTYDGSLSAAESPSQPLATGRNDHVDLEAPESSHDDASVNTQEETVAKYAGRFPEPATPRSPPGPTDRGAARTRSPGGGHTRNQGPVVDDVDHPAKYSWSPHVHFSEVLSTWIRPRDLPADGVVEGSGGVTPSVAARRQARRGVHHPKFMILLEQDGSMVLVVSTANLTVPCTTDASWVQRFPPRSAVSIPHGHPGRPVNLKGSTASVTTTGDPSDLGLVLANFLYCQTLATREGQLTPLAFVQRYLGWSSLSDLASKFDYSNAQVHLIATVPGDWGTSRENGQPEPFLYGRQRVAEVLKAARSGPRPWLPAAVLSGDDRLIFQPTSLGAEWNSRNLTDLVRSYMDDMDHDEAVSARKKMKRTCAEDQLRPNEDGTLLERMDIVWPSEKFIRQVRLQAGVPTQGMHSDCEQDKENTESTLESQKENEGYLFLSSETFNSIDLACISQMVMFTPSNPPQHPLQLVPHIKTVARLFCGSQAQLVKDFGFGKAEEYFPWFLLTSACLSRGAQGDLTPTALDGRGDTLSYSNFELGVLFCSRLQGKRRIDRLYCSNPRQNSGNTMTSLIPAARLVPLPVPYSLRPKRYQEDPDDPSFCETPYFHEIPPGTASVGHMRLTPYGSAIAARYQG